MPTYQYVCTDCAEQLEVQQSFSDEPLRVCPSCEGRLRKLFGAVGVVFKGSGFYRTDSRAAEAKAEAKAKENGSSTDAKPATKESASDSGPAKSEPKPAPKSPASSTPGKGSAA